MQSPMWCCTERRMTAETKILLVRLKPRQRRLVGDTSKQLVPLCHISIWPKSDQAQFAVCRASILESNHRIQLQHGQSIQVPGGTHQRGQHRNHSTCHCYHVSQLERLEWLRYMHFYNSDRSLLELLHLRGEQCSHLMLHCVDDRRSTSPPGQCYLPHSYES